MRFSEGTAVTGHNVRYVLIFALASVILAFIFIYAAFSG